MTRAIATPQTLADFIEAHGFTSEDDIIIRGIEHFTPSSVVLFLTAALELVDRRLQAAEWAAKMIADDQRRTHRRVSEIERLIKTLKTKRLEIEKLKRAA